MAPVIPAAKVISKFRTEKFRNAGVFFKDRVGTIGFVGGGRTLKGGSGDVFGCPGGVAEAAVVGGDVGGVAEEIGDWTGVSRRAKGGRGIARVD